MTQCCFKSIILSTGCALRPLYCSRSFYNTFAQRQIIIVFLVLSYLSYVAALLLCYTFKIHLFKLYSIYYINVNVFACFFMNVFYNTKSNVWHFTRFSRTHSLLFVNKNVSLGFIKLCTHDFSRVSFAAELSTTLVYNSVFVKIIYTHFIVLYYIYIYNIYITHHTHTHYIHTYIHIYIYIYIYTHTYIYIYTHTYIYIYIHTYIYIYIYTHIYIYTYTYIYIYIYIHIWTKWKYSNKNLIIKLKP